MDLVGDKLARLKDWRDNLYWDGIYFLRTQKAKLGYYIDTAYADLQDLVATNLARLKELRDDFYWAVWELKNNLLSDLRTYVLDYATKAKDFFLTRWDVALWYWGDVYNKVKTFISDGYAKLKDFWDNLYSHLAHIGRTIYDSLLETVVAWKDKLRSFVDYFARWLSLAVEWYEHIRALVTGDFWAKLFAFLSEPAPVIWAWLWAKLDYYICKYLAEKW